MHASIHFFELHATLVFNSGTPTQTTSQEMFSHSQAEWSPSTTRISTGSESTQPRRDDQPSCPFFWWCGLLRLLSCQHLEVILCSSCWSIMAEVALKHCQVFVRKLLWLLAWPLFVLYFPAEFPCHGRVWWLSVPMNCSHLWIISEAVIAVVS